MSSSKISFKNALFTSIECTSRVATNANNILMEEYSATNAKVLWELKPLV